MSVISELGKKTILELSTAVFLLAGLGIFFACRSCEYLKVSAAEQRQTKIFSFQNIQFFKEGHLLTHNHDELEFAFADLFQSLLNSKRKMRKWIRSHRWHQAMSHFAQFA
jgi:hypothetical protein